MNSQKNEKSTQKNIDIPISQKPKIDLEKKLHSENAKVFQQIFGEKAPEKKTSSK